jgi:hypothetical protein
MSFREIAKDFAAMNIFNRKGNLWNHVSISRVMKTNAA